MYGIIRSLRPASGQPGFALDLASACAVGIGEELATVARDGVLWSVSMAPDGVTIVTGDGAGIIYCLRYVELQATGSG